MTEDVLRKLEDAFMNAFTDEMACLYAGIGTTALYDYCEEHQAFAERKEILKQTPNLVAQKTLVGDLNNTGGARWWAERKMPEFKPKSEVKHSGAIGSESTEEEAETNEITQRFEAELRASIAARRKKRKTV